MGHFSDKSKFCHRDVRAYLDKNLQNIWVERRDPTEYPARSLDLMPMERSEAMIEPQGVITPN